MRKAKLSAAILSLACMVCMAQPTNRNYIATRVYTNADGTSWRDKYVYYDELGREEQSFLVAASPKGGSITTLQEYDVYGRSVKTWLQGRDASNSGSYITSQSTLENYIKSSNQDDSKPYTFTEYEASPLNRPKAEYGAGADWQNNGKAVKTEYGINVSGDTFLNCIKYTVSYNGTTANVSNIGNWPTGSQTVTKVTDEDGNVNYEFKDRNGEIVLQRQVLNNSVIDTYLIRNGWGYLLAVLPPAASTQLTTIGSWSSASSDILKNYAYFYKYDDRYRMTGKKLPGCDWIYIVYDSSDTPILTQDGKQRQNNQWTYTLKDVWGRPCVKGTCTGNYSEFSTVVKATRTATSGSYAYSGLPFSPSEILSEQYYDNYSFVGCNGFPTAVAYNSGSGYDERDTDKPLGMETGRKIRILNDNSTYSYLYSATYYDYRYRPIQQKGTNHLGGIEQEYVSYNFDGQPAKRKTVHAINGQTSVIQEYIYTYDAWGRSTQVMHKLNGGEQTTITNNSYDDIGRLEYKKRNGVYALQSKITYNVRSWTESITGALFSETLYYNNSRNTKRFNGNVSAIDWVSDNKLRGYDFEYDNLSRLTCANYLEGGARSNKYSTSYTYDPMGNILKLKRHGLQDGGTYGLIDNLTFTYNGNQVIRIDDSVNDPTYNGVFNFVDGASQANEYTYDKNGNLTKDLNKKISLIQYNLLNLPTSIAYSTGKSAAYIYDATGKKLRASYKASPSAAVQQTDYCGNMIYENNVLKQILVDGGYITFSGSTPQYHYYLKDHLGNNRVVCSASGAVEQVNHYYPFGGLFGESTGGDTQRYKYNGKELDRMHGLDWYDYGARHMDGMRFTTIDPLAGDYYSISPYAYCANNPINAIDPDGKSIWGKGLRLLYHAGKGIAKNGFKALTTAETYASAFEETKENINVLTDESASTWDKIKAGASLASEILPVGVGEIKDANKFLTKMGVRIPANNGVAKPHGGLKHNEAIDNRIESLKGDPGVSDIRKNQKQVDFEGNTVGNNRPDVQYNKDGIHYNIEYDTKSASLNKHKKTIPQNDPNSINEFNLIKK